IGTPPRVSAIKVPQAGRPQMKDLVPSIGSSTQTYSASGRSAPSSSPTTPCSGKVRLISARMAASAARSAAVTGSKPPDRLLFSTLSALRKNGRMVSPETVASSSTKAAKSIAVINGLVLRGSGEFRQRQSACCRSATLRRQILKGAGNGANGGCPAYFWAGRLSFLRGWNQSAIYGLPSASTSPRRCPAESVGKVP